MSQRESVVQLLAILVAILIAAPYTPTYPNSGIVNPFECRQVEGTVVGKVHDDIGYRIFVQVNINGVEGYEVWVSNKTYNAYEVGNYYEQIICDVLEWEELLQQFEDLQNVGILIPTT